MAMEKRLTKSKIETLQSMLLARFSRYPLRFPQAVNLFGDALTKTDKVIFPMAMFLTATGLLVSMFSLHQMDCAIEPRQRWFDKFKPT